MEAIIRDRLFECFEKLLESAKPDDSPEIFISRVAEDYLMDLVRNGHIPLKYLEPLREDICLEVQDMLRIKTYGYVNLGEYLSVRRSQPKSAVS